MGILRSGNSRVNGLGGSVTRAGEQTTSAQRIPKQSEIRGLGGDAHEQTQEYELVGLRSRHESVGEPPLTLDAAAEHYGRLASGDPDVMRALQIGDLPRAIVALIHENFTLRGQNASWQSDFEELRSVNIAQQEDADARLAAADEERLQLLEQLERVRSEVIEIETQSERTRRDYEDDLETLRQQRDALVQELFELKTQA